MKPTIWYYASSVWCCGCIDFSVEPAEDSEDYIKWLATGYAGPQGRLIFVGCEGVTY